jgi:hypothetical protein
MNDEEADKILLEGARTQSEYFKANEALRDVIAECMLAISGLNVNQLAAAQVRLERKFSDLTRLTEEYGEAMQKMLALVATRPAMRGKSA